jgi:hypothetical protein
MHRIAFFGIGALILVSLAGQLVSGWFTQDGSPPAAAAPADAFNWNGTWQSGNALIRINGRRGHFSPDGESVVEIAPRQRCDALVWKARIRGRTWSMWFTLTRTGEFARLAGVQEAEPRGAYVSAPGRTDEDRAQEAEARKEEARRLMVPTDFGTFVRR